MSDLILASHRGDGVPSLYSSNDSFPQVIPIPSRPNTFHPLIMSNALSGVAFFLPLLGWLACLVWLTLLNRRKLPREAPTRSHLYP